MRSKRINIPIYYGLLTIYIVNDESEMELIMKKHKMKGSSHGYEACFFPDHHTSGFTQYYLCIKQDIKPHNVAHECIHFVNELFSDRGIGIDPRNDEPYAYFLGWAVKQCHTFLDKHNSLTNSK